MRDGISPIRAKPMGVAYMYRPAGYENKNMDDRKAGYENKMMFMETEGEPSGKKRDDRKARRARKDKKDSKRMVAKIDAMLASLKRA